MSEYVYFVGNDKQVKIGKSKNVTTRIASIQTSSPVDIQVLATVRCISMSETEKMLHSAFARLRYKGEWFHNAGDLTELIKRLRTYEKPTEFNLGVELGSLSEQVKGRDAVIAQHRLRAIHKALRKMNFDVNAKEFHDAQNEFLSFLVDEHPTVYKQFITTSNGVLNQITDAPYQPFPVYEVSIAALPDERIIDKRMPNATAA